MIAQRKQFEEEEADLKRNIGELEQRALTFLVSQNCDGENKDADADNSGADGDNLFKKYERLREVEK